MAHWHSERHVVIVKLMKSKLVLIILGLVLAIPHEVHAIKVDPKALKCVFTLVVGAASAECLSRADQAHSVYKAKGSIIQNGQNGSVTSFL